MSNRSGISPYGRDPFPHQDFNIVREPVARATNRAMNGRIVQRASGGAIQGASVVTSYDRLFPTWLGDVFTIAQRPGIVNVITEPESTGLDVLQSSLTNW